ncbi:MAG: hypothetical protein IPH13_10800 [Planctomycetes bacterium]|nr:hypothetical protein [Planctomycetota bacterium]MCC7172522.1 hypothetical protein [Planctomycetota bacterium]
MSALAVVPVLAANPLQWIFDNFTTVLFVLFFVLPSIAQVFKRKQSERQQPTTPTPDATSGGGSPELAHDTRAGGGNASAGEATPRDLEDRVRRYFEELTGQTTPELEPDTEDVDELADDPAPTRAQANREVAREQAYERAQEHAAQREANPHAVHRVFADLSNTDVAGEEAFDTRVAHGDVAPQLEVKRRNTGKSAATRRLDLHDEAQLRKAVVLLEVLGPPIALRDERRF